MVYDELKYINRWLVPLIGPKNPWYFDWKLIGGAAVWAGIWFRWLVYGYDRDFSLKAVFVLSLDLVSLALVEEFKKTGFLWVLLLCTCNGLMGIRLFKGHCDLVKDTGYSAQSVYDDVSSSKMQCCFIFMGQCYLFYLVLCAGWYDMHDTSYYFNDEDMTLTYFVAAYISAQMSAIYNRGGDSQVGDIFHLGLWTSLVDSADRVTFQRQKHVHSFGEDETVQHFGPPFTVPKWECCARGFMAFIVNGIIREIVATCIAVVIMTSPDPLSFVLNCLAFTYITQLDFISGANRIKVCIRAEAHVELLSSPRNGRGDRELGLVQCEVVPIVQGEAVPDPA